MLMKHVELDTEWIETAVIDMAGEEIWEQIDQSKILSDEIKRVAMAAGLYEISDCERGAMLDLAAEVRELGL